MTKSQSLFFGNILQAGDLPTLRRYLFFAFLFCGFDRICSRSLEGQFNQAYDSDKKNQLAKQIWVFKSQRESAIASLWSM